MPLRLSSLIESVDLATEYDVDRPEIILGTPSCLGNSLRALEHLAYNAERPWSQMCWFAKFKVLEEVVNCETWLREGLTLLINEPLIFVDRDGDRQEFREDEVPTEGFLKAIVWQDSDLYNTYHPRRLPIYPVSQRLIEISRNSLETKGTPSFFAESIANGDDMKKKTETTQQKFTEKDGTLTDWGKRELQACGRKWSDLTTQQIIELLPRSARKIPEKVIRAHIAVGRRKK
jgi:hypothetical protein